MTPTQVAQVMAETLDIDELDKDRSFFEAGGNSFLTLTVMVKIREQCGASLTMIDIIRNPTPEGVSALVGRESTADEGPAA